MAETRAKVLGGLLDIVEGFKAVDLSTGANTGDYVSMKNWNRCLILFHSAVGTAGDDPTLTVQQASSATGTGVKNLTFDTIYRKQAATDLSATGVWTKTTQTAANTYTEATAAEQDLLWVIEIKATDLDVDGGFDFIRATVADVGTNAQLGFLLYIFCEPAHANAPENVLSTLL